MHNTFNLFVIGRTNINKMHNKYKTTSHIFLMTTPPSCTLVTACYDMHQYNPKCRTIEESIKLITPLLKIPVYLVIYGSKNTLNKIECIRNSFGFQHITKYICQELEELWTYQFLDQVKANRQQFWPTRDERTCSESHIVCCNKFDFVMDTIYTNPFNTTHFGWIDAFLGTPDGKGLRICENYRPNTVPRILHQLNNTKHFHIQVLNVNDKKFLKPEHKREYYTQYRWVVCGGFFVTAPEIGIKVLTRLKEVFVETTIPKPPLTYGFGHGEEMFYLEVLNEWLQDPAEKIKEGAERLLCPSLVTENKKEGAEGTLVPSLGDYGQILDNFIVPTANIEYVYHTIIQGFKKMGYEKEYKVACAALLQSANEHWIQLEPAIFSELVQA